MNRRKKAPKKEFGLFDATVSVVILLLLVLPGFSLLFVAFFSFSDRYEVSVFWGDTTTSGQFGLYPKSGGSFVAYGTHSLHANYSYSHQDKKYQANNDLSSLAAIYLTQIGATKALKHEARVSKLVPAFSMLSIEYNFLIQKSLCQILLAGLLWLIQFGTRKYITKHRTFD